MSQKSKIIGIAGGSGSGMRDYVHYTALLQDNASFPIMYICHQVKNLGKT